MVIYMNKGLSFESNKVSSWAFWVGDFGDFKSNGEQRRERKKR